FIETGIRHTEYSTQGRLATLFTVYRVQSTDLSHNQFAAAILLEGHSRLQGLDRGFQLAVVRLASGDALKPEAGLRCPFPQATLRLCGKADKLVGKAGDHRQQNDPPQE